MMIEVRITSDAFARMKNEVLASISLVQCLTKLGVPLLGRKLIMCGVSSGTMHWYIEDDIDGETYVWRWHDVGVKMTPSNRVVLETGRDGDYTWTKFGLKGTDDEL